MGEHVVARVGDIPDGESLTVTVEGRTIGVFHVNGEYFAIANRCAHQGGPLCDGAVMPTLTARVTERGRVKEYFDHERPVICCPWHGWEYDLRTGHLLGDPSRRVRTYETRLEQGEVKLVV
jgi:nitrite reductase/ring-hydroxylating ferredoxin subunit